MISVLRMGCAVVVKAEVGDSPACRVLVEFPSDIKWLVELMWK